MDSINEIEQRMLSSKLSDRYFMHNGSRVEVFGEPHIMAFCYDTETASYLVEAANSFPLLLDEIKYLRAALQEALDKTEPDEHVCPKCGGKLTYYQLVRCIECTKCGWAGQSLHECAHS